MAVIPRSIAAACLVASLAASPSASLAAGPAETPGEIAYFTCAMEIFSPMCRDHATEEKLQARIAATCEAKRVAYRGGLRGEYLAKNNPPEKADELVARDLGKVDRGLAEAYRKCLKDGQ